MKSWRGEYGVVNLESSDCVFIVPPEWRGMSKLAFAFEDLAEPELPLVGGLVEPGTIAIDAGSHYGDYTLALARAVGDDGEVWAIDPSPDYMSICRANVALNALTKVRFLECGLSDHCGVATLVDETDPSRSYVSNEDGGCEIVLDTLDRLYGEYGHCRRISFVKLDIEGSELPALRGMLEVIRNCQPVILIELQQLAQLRAGSCNDQIWHFLESFGYSLFTFSESGELVRVPVLDGSHANYIAAPPEQDRNNARTD